MKPYFAFQWHITDDCDQRCKHCYIFSADPKRKLQSMNWSQMEQTLDNCLEFGKAFGRTPYFYITGGDPILHPDFWKLLERISSYGLEFTILGNPFHLNDEVCAHLKKLGCRQYQLSLDGLEKTHDWFRKPGSYQATLAAIEMLNQAGITSAIMTTVSETNREEIPDLIDEVVTAHAGLFAFSRYVTTGGEVDAAMSPEDYRELLAKCDQKFKDYQQMGVKTWFSRKDHLWTLYRYETGEFKVPADAKENMIYQGCSCGAHHFTILPSGDVYACRRVENSKVGNVFEDRLKDLWLNEMEEYREYEQFSKCSRCRLLAWCRGCPAVAKGIGGSFYSEDPQCWASEENGLLQSIESKPDLEEMERTEQ